MTHFDSTGRDSSRRPVGAGSSELFATAGRAVSFGAGDVLVDEGAYEDHCYVLLSGEVLVSTSSLTGATVVLNRCGRGDIIGQLSALDGGPRSARVVARDDVTARRLSRTELEQLLLAQPEFALAELRRLSADVRALSLRVRGRSEELRVRTVDLLSTHAEATGDPVFRSTREELAGWLGATREAVTRTLRDLAEDGVVALRRSEVELLN